MKIRKSEPTHWIYLALFFLQSLLGLGIRSLPKRKGCRPVILYGHKLNGNLLAFYSYLTAARDEALMPVFLTMDLNYHRKLKDAGINSCWACSASCAALLGHAAALVSDHGLHSLQPLRPLYRRMGLYFFDVWHGIPFKGFDADDFQVQRRYDEAWVASDLNRRLYLEQFGFEPKKVAVTGYARTDKLVQPTPSLMEVRRKLGLPLTGNLILFAPTWAQDVEGRSIFPFGHSEDEFLNALSGLGQRHQATIVLRSHLNSAEGANTNYHNIIRLPSSTHPDTEEILLACDVMICDWSSIAFDYLLLDRPTFFLDVPPPFRKGFSLGPEYRFGEIVGDLTSLISSIDQSLSQPDQYWIRNRERHERIKNEVYGGMADGCAAKRYFARLKFHVFNYESSL